MKILATAFAAALIAGSAQAEPTVGITKSMVQVTIQTESGPLVIDRIQDPSNTITGDWARTSRPCPDFCIQPMIAAPGVSTIGELELLEMLQDPDAVVVDSRTSDWFQGGTIPGAINIPYIYMSWTSSVGSGASRISTAGIVRRPSVSHSFATGSGAANPRRRSAT